VFAIIQFKIVYLPVSYPKKLRIKIYKTVILPILLYGSEALSLALREEHRLRASEEGVLRIF
jgi:hypothetical protein